MSKGYYTFRTEGSETIVHWHGPPGKSIARCVNSGPFGYPSDPAPPRPTESDQGGPTQSDLDRVKKRKRKKRDQ